MRIVAARSCGCRVGRHVGARHYDEAAAQAYREALRLEP